MIIIHDRTDTSTRDLGGWKFAYAIGEYARGGGWNYLQRAGSVRDLSPGQPYNVRLTLTGRGILLDVDGFRVLEHVFEKPLIGKVGLFAWGHGETRFADFSLLAHSGLFVVMPFSELSQQLYEGIIKPAAQDFGLQPEYARETSKPGIILQDITQGIAEAKIVIADITPKNEAYNANVFYEVGYAHALNKPTILLAERERTKGLPFDISGYRVLYYKNTIAGKEKLDKDLRNSLKKILDDSRNDRNGS
jgi:hypothetical protein